MNYETVFLIGSLVIGIGGFVVLWFISKHTPRGTVLAISILLYMISQALGPNRIRELHMLSGLLGMLGFGGGILGLLDLVKPRTATESKSPTETTDSKTSSSDSASTDEK